MADENTLLNSDLESRYEKYKGIIKNFTLMSDIFMRNVFKKRECLEYVLQVIMEKQDLYVIDQVIQKDYKNLQGRSAVMDCVARDSAGKQFDVEIQQDNEGASPKRARYHSGLMDMNTLNPGQDFEELPESYVIFITRDDILGYGLPIYHIDRQIKELNEAFQDEAHIIYVNSRKQDDTELGKLMHDLHCKKADEMHSPILAKRVYELKETQKGVELMCHEMEKIYSEGMESGEKRGELKKAKETALSMAEEGMDVKMIARLVKVSEKDVQKWIDETLCVNGAVGTAPLSILIKNTIKSVMSGGGFVTHDQFKKAADYWKNKKQNAMPEEKLKKTVLEYINSNNTCALATGTGDYVRCTPIEYSYHDGKFWMFSEGGEKFIGLEKNENVCLAIYDKYDGADNLKSIQVIGKADLVEPFSDTYNKHAKIKKLPVETLKKLASPMNLICVTPVKMEVLFSEFKKNGYSSRQTIKF